MCLCVLKIYTYVFCVCVVKIDIYVLCVCIVKIYIYALCMSECEHMHTCVPRVGHFAKCLVLIH